MRSREVPIRIVELPDGEGEDIERLAALIESETGERVAYPEPHVGFSPASPGYTDEFMERFRSTMLDHVRESYRRAGKLERWEGQEEQDSSADN